VVDPGRALLRVRRGAGTLLDSAIDRRLGVTTTGVTASAEQVGKGLPYEPVRWVVIARLLRDLRLTREDVLLDAGCGKGRIVLRAAIGTPVRRAIGFDIATPLVEVAKRNAERTAGRIGDTEVDLEVADATTREIPDDVTVVVLNNPFLGDVLERFLDRVYDSLARRPRRLRLLYVWPAGGETVAASGATRVWRREASRTWPAVELYELEARPF
jgi:cyclopropane fatty-acyl-phospholipid synthase-like methyltransferase